MTTYWTNTKSNVKYKHAHDSAERDAIVRESLSVDPRLLTHELRLNETHVRAYQRRLGLRDAMFKTTGKQA